MGSLFPNPAPVINVAGGEAFISRTSISRSVYFYFKRLGEEKASLLWAAPGKTFKTIQFATN